MSEKFKPRYDELEQEEDASDISPRTAVQPTTIGWRKTIFAAFLGAIIASAIVSLIALQCYPQVRYKALSERPCGHSADEAEAAGCIFDPMMNSWLAPDCYDEELSMEFRSWRNWTFYRDENATQPLTLEEFSRVGQCWGTWEFHIAHCAFAVRKLQRAVRNGWKLERAVASEEHAAHCLHTANVTFTLIELAKERGEHFSMQDMGTVLHTGFPTCLEMRNYLPYKGVVL
ncbi:hypothetical protein BDY17DRAFT_301461 [Neohortaea acidophila]|uniref:Uncharacterized protein n=1 Tax=Neohortaea acidophila TaxID=245834 RepID=A0A6A6PND1_9PEZI|nr:uncharacterized protein BDY17DRAFT_301461 [Neohortaea acidophila]KAF2481512.1 hypothetical protein BDY17DRAFT_301461 [Neohortaea acidophila]